jgi:hypothetical protein
VRKEIMNGKEVHKIVGKISQTNITMLFVKMGEGR